MEDEDTKLRTIWCGNISGRVTDEIVYELFLQAGPIEAISLPKDKHGVNRGYAFITYKHQCTVNYAIQLFEGTSLYDRKLRITSRGGGSGSMRKSESFTVNPLPNRSIDEKLNNQQISNNLQAMNLFLNKPIDEKLNSQQIPNNFQADFSKPLPSLLNMPLTMSPIPLAEASLRGQWSHSSPYQQSPPKNHKHDLNRRYQDRYQSSYYDRKRDDRNRSRRK